LLAALKLAAVSRPLSMLTFGGYQRNDHDGPGVHDPSRTIALSNMRDTSPRPAASAARFTHASGRLITSVLCNSARSQ